MLELSTTLPLYCQHCGTAIEVRVDPLPEGAEEDLSGFACPACKKINHGLLGGLFASVRVRLDPGRGKVGRVH